MIGKIFQVIEVKNIAENYIKGEENFDFSPPPPPHCVRLQGGVIQKLHLDLESATPNLP